MARERRSSSCVCCNRFMQFTRINEHRQAVERNISRTHLMIFKRRNLRSYTEIIDPRSRRDDH